MKISFIATVFNEEESIDKLLSSLLNQSKFPDEIIIVDGGSTDATASIISNFKFQIVNKQKKIKFKYLIKKGNRSVGRNEAIKNATGDVIVCSDAGCILDQDWVENISAPFTDIKIDVVAGYYKGFAKNVFQKCLVPYVLVMPDMVDQDNFLPSARSMAFRKSVWKKAGGFPEEFSDNEDYVFVRALKKKNVNIVFEKRAIVGWLPRKNMKEAFAMFFQFARGDVQAKILRPKVSLIFIRYIIGLFMLVLGIIRNETFFFYVLAAVVIVYILYSIYKNYKYVKNLKAVLILPMLQIVSDIAVIAGTINGLIRLWVMQKMQ